MLNVVDYTLEVKKARLTGAIGTVRKGIESRMGEAIFYYQIYDMYLSIS